MARDSFHPAALVAFAAKGKSNRMPGKSLTKKFLRFSGIYQIRCITNGKIYIGSAVNMPGRWADHRRTLERCVHRNQHLQQAWNKYGEESFEFTVMEYVTPAFLLRAEQEWIDKSQCINRKIGFNIYPIAGSPGDSFARVWEGFIDPHGNEVTITNLERFCQKKGLNRSSMSRLARGKGKLKSYKGWTHKTASVSVIMSRLTMDSLILMAILWD
jgi:group I intron endonuclease